MFLIEALGLVILQSPEHFAALNVMTVNNKVIAARKVAVFLNIRCTQVAVFLFKIALQIVVRLIRRLHHGIIEGCAGYGKPANHIRVFQKQLFVLCKDIIFLGQGNFWDAAVLCLCLLHDFGNILKGCGLLGLVGIVVVNTVDAKCRRTQQAHGGNRTNDRFVILHRFSFLILYYQYAASLWVNPCNIRDTLL